jgi:hypothetical protein
LGIFQSVSHTPLFENEIEKNELIYEV